MRAKDIVFIDESLFNETNVWRKKAWPPVGQPARYHHDNTRGKSWSILPAYAIEGYLPCIGIIEGYYNTEAFRNWVENLLLPCCGKGEIIIMDNNSTHIDARVRAAIGIGRCKVRFLLPYSPDYYPLELWFSVLEAWVRRRFYRLWLTFEGDFGAFLS